MNYKKIKVCSVQDSPVFLDKSKTVAKACELIEKAAQKGAKLVVFPEAFISAYPDWTWIVSAYHKSILDEMYYELLENAVSIPDDATQKICSAARKYKIYVAMGINERNKESSNSSLFNSILYIDHKGNILGIHRKLIPTGPERTIWSQGDGNTLNSFETSLGRLCGLICWENFMPLARNFVYSVGSQIHVSPTWDSSDGWLNAIKFIAREGGMFVVNSCQAIRMKDIPKKYEFKKFYPDGKDWINKGNCCIINPAGKYVTEPMKEIKKLIIADIDFAEISASKRLFDVTGHYSRSDVFNFSVNKVEATS